MYYVIPLITSLLIPRSLTLCNDTIAIFTFLGKAPDSNSNILLWAYLTQNRLLKAHVSANIS